MSQIASEPPYILLLDTVSQYFISEDPLSWIPLRFSALESGTLARFLGVPLHVAIAWCMRSIHSDNLPTGRAYGSGMSKTLTRASEI